MNSALLLRTLSLAAAGAWAAFDASGWSWRKPFEAPAAPQLRVALDGEVFGGTRQDLADLRVTGPAGEETPYLLETESESDRQVCASARLFNRVRTAPGDLRFELDLGEGVQPHNRLHLGVHPDDRDFRVPALLEGSKDAIAWAVLARDSSLLDFSESVRLRHTELEYPEADFRYLRVTLKDRAKPLRVTGASVRRRERRPGAEEERAHAVEPGSDPESLSWVVDLGHDRVPAHRVAFEAGPGEFKRRVVVYAPASAGAWTEIGSGVIYRYQSLSESAPFRGESLSVSFPEQRQRRLRVRVFHYDDKPAPIGGLKVYGWARRIRLKEPRPGAYLLHYGNAQAAPPRYDLAELAAYLPTQDIPMTRLGAPLSNPDYRAPRKPWTEEHPWLLGAALAAAVLALAVLVAGQWKQVSRRPPTSAARRRGW
ncbi:MAG: DUF3999 family protein [Elusimicrobia bacterium]|nr:DUF3999 family protein [Elusimicrobiota bacterium]